MHILDTGPIFKFLATHCVPQLIGALGGNVINVPDAVEFEIRDTPTRKKQFEAAAQIWPKIPDRFKNVLSDEPTDELRACSRSVFGLEFEKMYESRKDRGENMAILHGVLLARRGEQVLIVCDDQTGVAMI